LATVDDNDVLRKEAAAFYAEVFGQVLPLEAIHCRGGRSDDVIDGCPECPFMACCKACGLDACTPCAEPCAMFTDYYKTYVNKINQV